MKASDFTAVSMLLQDRGKLCGIRKDAETMAGETARHFVLTSGYYSDSLKGVSLGPMLTDEEITSTIATQLKRAVIEALRIQIETIEKKLRELGVEVDL